MTSRNILLPLALLLVTSLTFLKPASAQTTAQSGFTEILTLAQAEASDATFLGLIGDNLSPESGESDGWFYVFESAENESIFGLIRSGSDISAPISLTEFPQEIAEMVTPGAIPSTWLDSNLALSVAEANGGEEFRSTYAESNITATLIGIPSTDLLDLELPPIPALWVITYTSIGEETAAVSVHVVDALFGFHLNLEHSTARDNLEAVEMVADEFSSDAELISVRTLLPDFTTNGEASVWVYTYYSEALQDGTMIFASSGLALGSTALLVDPISTQPLPENWFDSPYAAENVDFDNPLNDIIISPSLVQAHISNGLSEEQPNFAFWELNYVLVEEEFLVNLMDDPSLDDLSIQTFLINAEEIVTTNEQESVFTLIDSDADQPVEGFAPILQDAVLDLAFLPANLNISAEFDSSVERVQFELNGAVVNTEGVAPYALFGDNQGDFNAGDLPIGKHILRAIPTIDGSEGEPQVVSFEVINSLLPSVTGLVIIDASTDTELFEFNDGAAISISDLPAEVNIEATVNDRVKSVLFDLNQGFYKRLENVPPFAFFGDASGDFLPGQLPVGGHELAVTPYSEVMKGGEAGPQLVIRFTILDAASKAGSMQSGYFIEPLNGLTQDVPSDFVLHENYPNPFNPSTNISFELPQTSPVQIKIYDTMGRLVGTVTDATYEAGKHAVTFDASQLSSGLYIYQLITPESVISKKMTYLK